MKMKKPRTVGDFLQIIEALRMASTFCLASHFDDGMAHCMEMSLSGARALRRRGIDARALPCAIIGDRGPFYKFSVGLSASDIHKLAAIETPFEDWEGARQLPTDDALCAHMIIEARGMGQRVLIDLTFGQLRQDHGLEVPLQLVYVGNRWPKVQDQGWKLEYLESPRAARILEETKGWEGKGLADDLHDITTAALNCGCMPDRLLELLQRQNPGPFEEVLPRLRGFMRVAFENRRYPRSRIERQLLGRPPCAALSRTTSRSTQHRASVRLRSPALFQCPSD